MSHITLVAAGLLAAVGVALAGQSVDPQALLEKTRLGVAATVQRTSRYTCMQTVERSWYADHHRQSPRPGCEADLQPEVADRNLIRTDRLRLDVAVGSAQEIFSWHGEKRFRTEDIDQLVTAGPISSGTFFSFLSSIFLEGTAAISFREIHALARFAYEVPRTQSKFEINLDSGRIVTGYHGEFLVDIASGQIRKLIVITDEMPEESRICHFTLEIDYGPAEFQLPTGVVMDILDSNHEHRRTLTHYSQCQQFLGESAVHFDQATVQPSAAIRSTVDNLPAGLALDIKIKTAIKPVTSWAGDPIDGIINKDVSDVRGKLVIPGGTPVHGRLLRLENWKYPSHFYTLALPFDELTLAGHDFVLNLTSVNNLNQTSLTDRLQLDNSAIPDQPSACRFRLSNQTVTLKGAVTHWISK